MSEYGEFTLFFEAMKAEYLRHYPEKGDSWKEPRIWIPEEDVSNRELSHMGHWETTESLLKQKIRDVGYKFFQSEEPDELVDLANLCAMLWLRTSEKTEAAT